MSETFNHQHVKTANIHSDQEIHLSKMVKKKIDNRIRVMIENGVKMKHRTMFVIVGDKGRDQVK